jgi:hypothetical protein
MEVALFFVFAFIVVSLAYTIYSEWLNVFVRKSWAYSDILPVIPLFGTGLTPVLQWIVVPVIAWRLARQRRVKPE